MPIGITRDFLLIPRVLRSLVGCGWKKTTRDAERRTSHAWVHAPMTARILAKNVLGHHVIPTSASTVTIGFFPRRRRIGVTSDDQKRILFTTTISGFSLLRTLSTWKRNVGAMP